jgi:hypothetical protein
MVRVSVDFRKSSNFICLLKHQHTYLCHNMFVADVIQPF